MTKEKIFEQRVGEIANEITWLKGEVKVIEYSKGYIDGRLPNGSFFIISFNNEYEVKISVSKYGLHQCLIPIDKIKVLLRQLSK